MISYVTIVVTLFVGTWLLISLLATIEGHRKDGECMLSALMNIFKPYRAEEKDPVPGKKVLLSLVEENGERKVEVGPEYVYSRGDKKLLSDKVEQAMEKEETACVTERNQSGVMSMKKHIFYLYEGFKFFMKVLFFSCLLLSVLFILLILAINHPLVSALLMILGISYGLGALLRLS